MKNIVVTGGSGMMGESLKKMIPNAHYLSSKDYNLTDTKEVERLFEELKPNVIIHLAAKVGGILDNIKKPAEYFTDNILMNTNIVKLSHIHGVERFIGILSTCIYPDFSEKSFKYPMREEDLHDGPPTTTNFSYGYAKRSLAVQIEAYNKQYDLKYQYLTPCNLYGENDKFGDNSHFVSSLIKKIYWAKKNGQKEIILFGDGTPLRQFMHSDDLAYVINYCLENEIYDNFNVATEENLSILEIAKTALKACDAENLEIKFDTSKPNGQMRKDVSIQKMNKIIPHFKPMSLHDGIKKTFENLNEQKLID